MITITTLFTVYPHQITLRHPIAPEAERWCFNLSPEGFNTQNVEKTKWARILLDFNDTWVYCFKHEADAIEFKLRFC